jgi:hypothetical protein
MLFTVIYFGNGPYGLASVGWGILFSEITSSLILPFFLVKNKMRQINSPLDDRSAILAIQPILVLGLCYSLMAFSSLSTWLISSLGLITMIFFYYLMWKRLEEDVQLRLKSVVYKLTNLRKSA